MFSRAAYDARFGLRADLASQEVRNVRLHTKNQTSGCKPPWFEMRLVPGSRNESRSARCDLDPCRDLSLRVSLRARYGARQSNQELLRSETKDEAEETQVRVEQNGELFSSALMLALVIINIVVFLALLIWVERLLFGSAQ